MAIQYKNTKPKKEKPVKIKQEKPVKIKQEKPVKIKQDKPVKIKQEKPVNIKKEKSVKIKQHKQSKDTKPLNTVNLKKNNNSNRSGNARKPKNIKAIIGISVALVLVLALVIVILTVVNNYKKQGNEISYILISSTPNDTDYFVGEEADYDGLIVKATRRNGEQFIVPISECKITGFDSSAPAEKQTISVQYEGFIVTFSITIKEMPKPTPVLMNIYFEKLPKTEYKVGEWLETSGGVFIREYKDGTTKRLNLVNSYIRGWEEAYAAGPGTYTLTVVYVENGDLAETTYDITITE